jgi:hypothetical protein
VCRRRLGEKKKEEIGGIWPGLEDVRRVSERCLGQSSLRTLLEALAGYLSPYTCSVRCKFVCEWFQIGQSKSMTRGLSVWLFAFCPSHCRSVDVPVVVLPLSGDAKAIVTVMSLI